MMKFRTEIEKLSEHCDITHDDHIVLLGSCFTDNIGRQLDIDGFEVTHNPFGTLYNPASIARCITCAQNDFKYALSNLDKEEDVWHCLDFASIYCDKEPNRLIDKLNAELNIFREKLITCSKLIITFGTAWAFEKSDSHDIVGNCHKFKPSYFTRRRMTVDEIVQLWQDIAVQFSDKEIIFTVSPIRHTADGLHGNSLSKSTLLLAVDELCSRFANCQYFPAFEIMNDDLRDYRFYAADMKHPSETAIDYIYDFFRETYFDIKTKNCALFHRKEALRAAHRQIIVEQ
jgi:Zn-finger protein